MKCDTIQELERYLQLQEQAMGKGSPELAITLSKLANLYTAIGNYPQAEMLHNRALEIRLSATEPNQSEIDDSKRSLSHIQELKDHASKAGGLKGSTKDDLLNKLDSAAQAHSLKDGESASTDKAQKLIDEKAIKEMELEVGLLKQMVGNDHPAVADSLVKLAQLYGKAKLLTNAEPVLVDVVRIRETICGADNAQVASDLINLAQLYVELEKYTLAEPLFQRAIALQEKCLGTEHPSVIALAQDYAKLLRKTNRVDQAKELEEHINTISTSSTPKTFV